MNIKRVIISSLFVIGVISAYKIASEINWGRQESSLNIRTGTESIARGRDIFESKCGFCHSPNSTEMISGPGLLGVLKRSTLPASKRPATPENIIRQLKMPYQAMPSFAYLSEYEIQDILAYLNTL